jgi:hypothetical protein
MRQSNAEFALTDIITGSAIRLDWSTITFNRGSIEWITKNNDTLGANIISDFD